MKKLERLLTPQDLADRWGMSVATLKKWRCIKKGPPFLKLCGKDKLGRDSIRYRVDDVLDYENKNRAG